MEDPDLFLPSRGLPELLLLSLYALLPIACVWNWWRWWRQIAQGNTILRPEPRSPVPWGLLDVGMAVVVVAFVVGLGLDLTRRIRGISPQANVENLPPAEQAEVFLGFALASLVASVLVLGWVHIRWPGVWRQHGFKASRLGEDLKLALRWFTMLMVPVSVLQLVLNIWQPTRHPLVEMMLESNATALLPVAAFAAVVAAPIFEECLFRLIIQGWLEKLVGSIRRAATCGSDDQSRRAVLLGDAKRDSHPSPATPAESDLENPSAYGWLPIYISSGLFALAHLGHGPDWIPLFFLALGLGFLYQRTGRIQAPMMVHMLVNAVGILQLWIYVRNNP